jgi:hypothetical protein
MVKDIAEVKQEGLSQLEYQFPTCHFHKNDPKGLVLQHALQVSSCWLYAHENFEDEIFIERDQDWEEVLHRRANPNMTKFKSTTMDEQVETIEKYSQEAFTRVREENKATKAIEARIRGMLLLEEANRAMQILGEDPLLNPLIGTLRITPDDTNGHEA